MDIGKRIERGALADRVAARDADDRPGCGRRADDHRVDPGGVRILGHLPPAHSRQRHRGRRGRADAVRRPESRGRCCIRSNGCGPNLKDLPGLVGVVASGAAGGRDRHPAAPVAPRRAGGGRRRVAAPSWPACWTLCTPSCATWPRSSPLRSWPCRAACNRCGAATSAGGCPPNPGQPAMAAGPLACEVTSSITVWMNCIFSSTAGRQHERVQVVVAHRPVDHVQRPGQRQPHVDDRVESRWGPAAAGRRSPGRREARTPRRCPGCRGCAGSGRRSRPSPRRDAWWRTRTRSSPASPRARPSR